MLWFTLVCYITGANRNSILQKTGMRGVIKDVNVKKNLSQLHRITIKGSLTVWALYAYFSDSQNAAFELLVWCM